MAETPHIRGFKLIERIPFLIGNTLPELHRLALKHDGYYVFDGGPHQQLHVISKPDWVKFILKDAASNFQRGPVINALKPLLGDGIFITDQSPWKSRHDALKPALKEDAFEPYLNIAREEMERLMDQWISSQTVPNVERDIERFLLKILVRGVFGYTGEVHWDEIILRHKAILNAAGIARQKIDYYVRKVVGKKRLPRNVERYQDDLQYLELFANEILAHSSTQSSVFYRYIGDQSAEFQRDMVLNILFAGYDTTASALSMTIHQLGAHPEWQEACRKDQIRIEHVIQESMRLYPPVWALFRQNEEEVRYEDEVLLANTYVMIDVYSLHRQPEQWEEPLTFNPNRFSKTGTKGMAFTYLPFGQGQRMCIGKPLAMRELTELVKTLTACMSWTLNGDRHPSLRTDIILKTKKGFSLSVRKLGT